MGRLGLAFRCFFRVLSGKPLPEEALELAGEKEQPRLPAAEAPRTPTAETAIQLLGLLQKEGRLLDFLLEDIEAYTDAQVGAAVRNIHRDCQEILKERIGVKPVLDGEEESQVTVDSGFDPSRIRLIGNVTGDPPFSGVLKHHGWYAGGVNLPPLPQGYDPLVIAPAEVELP